tara:strand:+ start:1991 stop:2650 length:660 start_codon:yes stop_codon:yes gene_type:complete
MNKNKFNLIVFDWDGTLYDSTAVIINSIQRASADLGYRIPGSDLAASVIGLGFNESMKKIFPNLDKVFYPKIVERYRYHYSKYDSNICLFKGAEEMIKELFERGYYLAVATGKSRSGLNRALNKTNIGKLFKITKCADETLSKPNPLMLTQIVDELGVDREKTLMIGDTIHDLQLARNAGTFFGAVYYGANSKMLLESYFPLFCVGSIEELKNWLKNNV